MDSPVKLIIIATVLLIIGVVLPFMMVLELLEKMLVLSAVSFVCSTAGLIMGFIGIAQYTRARR